MIGVKHFMDAVEADDGTRIWVEPMGLTRDLRSLCRVDCVFPHVGPPRELWEWFETHPLGYDYFRGRYHEYLAHSSFRPTLQQLATAAVTDNFTLLHQAIDPEHNTAMALYEFLSELTAYCPPEL
jgi:uncharacterized protein YeaO (DUF488 family)